MSSSKNHKLNSYGVTNLSTTSGLDVVREKNAAIRAQLETNSADIDSMLKESLQTALAVQENLRLKQLELAQSNNGATTTPQTISTVSATPPSSLIVARQGWSGPAPTLAKKTRSADAEHRSRCSLM